MLTLPDSVSRFDYDATGTSMRRKAPVVSVWSEDRMLKDSKRRVIKSAAADLQRNFSIAAWMIRKHLDYVSTFNFQARTGNDDMDEQVEGFMRWWSRPQNFDAAGRHSLARFIRLAECSRTIGGDVLVNQLADGRVQGVESDRVCSDKGFDQQAAGLNGLRITNGVAVNQNGRAVAYIVYRRNDETGQLEFDRVLPAGFAYLHGYYSRYDQVRGVSPLTAGINSLRDVYENFDYALAKAKIAQLFALAFYREHGDPLGTLSETGTDENGEATGYSVDFSKGPVQLDLDPGDRAEFLESKQPSSEFQSFTQAVVMASLKSLDIPYSFYDESHTNYSGMRVAWLQYDQSAEAKRADNVELLDRLTAWRLAMAIEDGDLALPAGMGLSGIRWEWINKGVPWVDQLKEVTSNIAAIGAGLASPQKIAKAQGEDVFETIDQIAEVMDYARERGVPLSFVPPPPMQNQQPNEDQDDNRKPNDDS